MTPEQIAALLATIVGAPIGIEFVKRWLEGRNVQFQTKDKQNAERDAREWQAMVDALARERQIYIDLLSFERAQFHTRLSEIEARIGKIQEEAARYQKLYWEERVVRERLQARVEHLENELTTRSYKNE